MDDLMDGWGGLGGTGDQLDDGRRGRWPRAAPGATARYNWHLDRFDRAVAVPVAPWLVVEGVGSGNPAIADLVTVLVWVEVDDDLRLARGLERDGARAGARVARSSWPTRPRSSPRTGPASAPTCSSTGPAARPRSSASVSGQSPVIDRRGHDQRAARGPPPRARAPVRALDAHDRRGLAVGQVERHPGRTGRQVDRDDLRPLVLAPAVAVDHDQPVRVRLDPGPQQAVEQRERQQPQHEQRAALEQREPLPGLGVEREPRERADDEQPGTDRDADDPRARAGRQVTGRPGGRAQSRQAWMSVTRIPRAPTS